MWTMSDTSKEVMVVENRWTKV